MSNRRMDNAAEQLERLCRELASITKHLARVAELAGQLEHIERDVAMITDKLADLTTVAKNWYLLLEDADDDF